MSAFVPDASVTLPWCFEDERTPYTQALLASLAGGYVAKVPSHWPIELLNALIQAKKRRRVSDAQIRSFLINLFLTSDWDRF